MKLRVLLVCVVALGLSASVAIAAPPPGKGKPASPGNSASAGKPLPTGPTCKPKVTVVLKGMVDSASASSLSVDVTSANRWGRAYVPGTALTPVTVDTNTKVRRNGNTTTAAGLLPGDWVLVQARVCKAELLAVGPLPVLTAARVVAHPASA
jgi:hypothetical protein